MMTEEEIARARKINREHESRVKYAKEKLDDQILREATRIKARRSLTIHTRPIGPPFIQYMGMVHDKELLIHPYVQLILRDHYRVPDGYVWRFASSGQTAGWHRPHGSYPDYSEEEAAYEREMTTGGFRQPPIVGE